MADDMWTISRCLDWTRGYLEKKGDERARYTAELLLTSVTGMSRVELYMNFDRPLDQSELSRMHDAVVRRAKGEPVQYITGSTGFRMIDVLCEPGVLIPRPETEVLVGEVLDYLDHEVLESRGAMARKRASLPWNGELDAAADLERARAESNEAGEGVDGDASPCEASGDSTADATEGASDPCEEVDEVARVLEVGCGTGCIALSLASERPAQVECVAIDINPQAVALTKKNRDALGIDTATVSVREGDLVSPVTDDEAGAFDVLVSNPPYIPHEVMETLPREVVDFEPGLALEGGDDGLSVFRRLLDAAPRMLKPGGLFACELFEESLDEAADLCRAAGMVDVRIVFDLTHRPRIVLAKTPA